MAAFGINTRAVVLLAGPHPIRNTGDLSSRETARETSAILLIFTLLAGAPSSYGSVKRGIAKLLANDCRKPSPAQRSHRIGRPHSVTPSLPAYGTLPFRLWLANLIWRSEDLLLALEPFVVYRLLKRFRFGLDIEPIDKLSHGDSAIVAKSAFELVTEVGFREGSHLPMRAIDVRRRVGVVIELTFIFSGRQRLN